MKTLKITAILLLLLTGFNSCKKVEGPKGDKGDQGIAGQNGSNGSNGQNGNANVIGTNEFTTSSGNWSQASSSWFCVLNVAAVTSDVANKGIIQVYIKTGSTWYAMPETIGINQTTYGFATGTVTLHNRNSTGTTPANPGAKTIRVVAITPSQIKENPNTDWKNYKEVREKLNL